MTSPTEPERPLHDYIDMEAYDVVAGATYRNLLEQFETLSRQKDEAQKDALYIKEKYEVACGDRDRFRENWATAARLLDDSEDERRTAEEQFETLQAAAMRLCNVHRWSYGGPETLVALANRIAESDS